MQQRFKITDYDGAPIRRFLGVCVERTVEGHYRLHQRPYILELLERLDLQSVKHAASPERVGSKAKLREVDNLSPADREFMASVPYREAVGALFYLSRATRPDIAHASVEVARFMDRPAPVHWAAVVRIYAYIAQSHYPCFVAFIVTGPGV